MTPAEPREKQAQLPAVVFRLCIGRGNAGAHMPDLVSTLSAAAFFALPVLAQLPDPQSSESVGWLVLTGAAVLVIIKNSSDLFRSWFVKSPPDHDRYAQKAAVDKESARIEARFETWMEEMCQKFEAHAKDSHAGREQIERAVGRIEGKIDAIKSQRR